MLAQQPRPVFRQTHHAIDEINLALEFGDRSLELRERATLAEWLRDELLPALDELFSFYAPGQQIIRFEELVFDFGRLPASDYRHIIREQLVHRLTGLIKNKSLPLELNNQHLQPESRITDPATALKLLLDYLRTGQLGARVFSAGGQPGANQVPAPKLHQQLLESLVGEQHIAAQLRALPNREQWLARLLQQFSERHRSALLRQLAAPQVEPALALLDMLQTAPLPAAENNVKNLWHALLHVALDHPTAQAQDWFNRVMAQWIADTGESGWEFIVHLHTGPGSGAVTASGAVPGDWQRLQSYADTLLREHHRTSGELEGKNVSHAPGGDQYQNQPRTAEHVTAAEFDTGKFTAQLAEPAKFAAESFQQGKLEPAAQRGAEAIDPLDEIDPIDEIGLADKTAAVDKTKSLDEIDLHHQEFDHSVHQLLTDTFTRADSAALISHWQHWRENYAAQLKAKVKLHLADAGWRRQILPALPTELITDMLALWVPGLKPVVNDLATHARAYRDALLPLYATSETVDATATRAHRGDADWLLQAYELIASQLVINASQGKPASAQVTPINYEDFVTAYAYQQGLPADKLHQQWQPIYTAGASQSNRGYEKVSNKVAAGNIHQQLARILVRGDAGELLARWVALQTAHKDLLVSALKHYLVKAELRQQLLLKLPESFIGELLGFIAPDIKPLVQQLELNAERLIAAQATISAHGSRSSADSEAADTATWLRHVYELLATSIFARVDNDTSDWIVVSSVKTVAEELIARIANQQDLPLDGLRVPWLALLQPGISQSKQAQESLQVISDHDPEAGETLFATATASIEGLAEEIQQAMAQQNVSQLESLWQEYLKSGAVLAPTNRPTPAIGFAAESIPNIIAQHWQQPEKRRVFLAGLSLGVLTQVFQAIAPAYQQWFTWSATQRTRLLRDAQKPGHW